MYLGLPCEFSSTFFNPSLLPFYLFLPLMSFDSQFQLLLGAPAYAVAGEVPTPRLRQKTYSINVMNNTAFGTMFVMVLPLLINPGNANLGGKVAFIFFGPSALCALYLWFDLPEMKGRSYLELEEMFNKKVPARKFKGYQTDAQIADLDGDGKFLVIMKQ